MAAIALIRRAAFCALLTGLAAAVMAEAMDQVIAPAYAGLADAVFALDATARIDFLRLGPVEQDGRSLAMAFWPDPKSSGPRAQQALVGGGSGVITDPVRFAQVSVAARGLTGLERLLYPSQITADESTLCALRGATAADLALMAQAVAVEWPAYAALLRAPGDANPSICLMPRRGRRCSRRS